MGKVNPVNARIQKGQDKYNSSTHVNNNHRELDKSPLINTDILRAYLSSYSREPFIRQLSKFLMCDPDEKSIKAMANKDPLRWAKAVQIFAYLSGYSEKIEIESTVSINMLSDTQVEARLAELEEMFQQRRLVDITPETVEVAAKQPELPNKEPM